MTKQSARAAGQAEEALPSSREATFVSSILKRIVSHNTKKIFSSFRALEGSFSRRGVSCPIEQWREVSHQHKFSTLDKVPAKSTNYFQEVDILRGECSPLSQTYLHFGYFKICLNSEIEDNDSTFFPNSMHNLSCPQTKEVEHGRLGKR